MEEAVHLIQQFMIMDVNVWKSFKNKKLKLEKGQAIFEFIIFLPFFILFFAVMVSVIGGINASINQQKTLRGYFFYTIRNNSTLPFNQDMDSYLSKGVSRVGAYSFGFSKEQRGDNQLGPCFRVPALRPRDDTCEKGIEGWQRAMLLRGTALSLNIIPEVASEARRRSAHVTSMRIGC